MKKTTKSVISVLFALAMLLGMMPASVFAATATTPAATTPAATTPAATDATATVAPTAAAADQYSGVGSYMAFVQCQTQTWVYRNQFNDKSAGFGTDIYKSIYNNETKAATSTVINDAVLDGDGEYTISLTDISLEGSTDWNMVGISTNIPLDSPIKVTAATLKYDSKTVTDKFVQKTDDLNYKFLMLINQYDPDMKDSVSTLVPADGSKMIITFTVEGFGYAKKVAEVTAEASATPTAAVTTAAAATTDTTDEDSSNKPSTGLIVGIIAGVVVVGIIIVIIVSSKKKKN